MRRTTTLLALPFLLAATGCELFSRDEDTSVRITIEQSLTGETTSEGTFTLTGAVGDAGTTNETLTFGGPLDQPVVPVTFTRTLTGAHGTITVTAASSEKTSLRASAVTSLLTEVDMVHTDGPNP